MGSNGFQARQRADIEPAGVMNYANARAVFAVLNACVRLFAALYRPAGSRRKRPRESVGALPTRSAVLRA